MEQSYEIGQEQVSPPADSSTKMIQDLPEISGKNAAARNKVLGVADTNKTVPAHLDFAAPIESSQPDKNSHLNAVGKEQSAYRDWYQSLNQGKVDEATRLALAYEYLRLNIGNKAPDVAERVRAVSQWVEAEHKRPYVEINLNKHVSKNKAPANEEIGQLVADSLGFSKGERAVYASLKGCEATGKAFFQQASDKEEGNTWLDLAKKDSLGRVRISELQPGAIKDMRDWLRDYRMRNAPPNGIDCYDWDKQRTVMEAIFAHTYNPAATLAGSAMQSVADIVQGAGLQLHIFTDRTFLDNLADYMRKEGRSLPMYSLYKKSELDDAMVGLINIYATAGGAAAPFMAGGAIARGVSLTPRAAGLMGHLIGISSTTGAAYDAALEIQAAGQAKREGITREVELLRRIDEIKKGERIGSNDRSEMETKALVTAAFALPVGAIQGKFLNGLYSHINAGTSFSQLPKDLLRNIAVDMAKGGYISATQLAGLQTSLVISGVQNGEEALKNTVTYMPEAAITGAIVGGSLRALDIADGLKKATLTADVQPEIRTPQIQEHARPVAPIEYNQQIRQQQQAESVRLGYQKVAGDRDVAVYKNGGAMQYLVGDQSINLLDAGGWWYGKTPGSGNTGELKIHIQTNSAADLARLHKVLIPALKNDPILREHVHAWKTMSPADAYPGGNPPDGVRQNSKAFTIYAPTPRQAAIIHGRIDQILMEKGLAVNTPLARDTVDRPSGQSNRVAFSADHVPMTKIGSAYAALIDDAVINRIKEKYNYPANQPFDHAWLRYVEQLSGIQPNLLHYDSQGRLAMRLSPGGSIANNRIYLDEAEAKSAWGNQTDRFAYYSLYRMVQVEPTALTFNTNRGQH